MRRKKRKDEEASRGRKRKTAEKGPKKKGRGFS
jgi:hypothetical protein